MKNTLVAIALVLMLLASASPADADTPILQIYFDRDLTQYYADCPYGPPGSNLDTLYLAATGFSTPIEGIEYSIVFPPEVLWVGDLAPDNGLNIGSSPEGNSIAFLSPLDASSPVTIVEMLIIWNCDGCYPVNNIPIVVTVHPVTGLLRAVTSDLVFEEAVGFTTTICATCLGCSPAKTTLPPSKAPAEVATEQCVLHCPAGDGGVILPGDPPGQYHSLDLDNDGVVGLVDFSYFAIPYASAYDPDMDFFCSGDIDLIDFVVFARHWLHSGSIPVEPSTWGKIKAHFSN